MTIHIQTLTIAVTGSALSITGLLANAAQAATITYSFDVNVTTGPLSGNTYGGSFSYDNAVSSGAGPLLLPYFEATDFKFKFSNQTFTLQDLRRDCRYGPEYCYPIQTEYDGTKYITGLGLVPGDAKVVSFGFSNYDVLPPYEPGPYFTIGGASGGAGRFFYGSNYGVNPPAGEGNVSYAVVPEPALTLSTSALALGFSALIQRKQARSQKAKS